MLQVAAGLGYSALCVNFSRMMGRVYFRREDVDIDALRARGFDVRRFVGNPRHGIWHWWTNSEAAILIRWGDAGNSKATDVTLNDFIDGLGSQFYLQI